MVIYYPTLTITTEHEDFLANRTATTTSRLPCSAYPRTIDGRSTHLYSGTEPGVEEQDYIFSYALDSIRRFG